jgi:protein phosphatase
MLGSENHSSIITNCIGGGCGSSYIDIVQLTQDVHVGDAYLLCSDGLTDMVPDEDIARLLSEGANASLLCSAAIENGGLDNVSACLITIK